MRSGISSSYADAVASERPRVHFRGWLLRIGALALAGAVLAVWFVTLRPVSLGGSTGYTIVSGQSMTPTLESRDLVVTVRQRSYAVGDVVVYSVPEGEAGAGVQVIHRIVGGSGQTGFVLKGDNKDGVDPWRPRTGDVVGKVRVTLPRAGVALLFLRTPLGLAILAGMTSLLVALALFGGADERPRGVRL